MKITDAASLGNAICSPDGVCSNTKCCEEKGFDGLRECSEIVNCRKGFEIFEKVYEEEK